MPSGVSTTLAAFDLDNTLLDGDSDRLWGEFLCEAGLSTPDMLERHAEFHRDYHEGRLDIHKYLRFQLGILADHPLSTLREWRQRYLQEKIYPIICPQAEVRVADHRERGHTLVIITSTNLFLTGPIAQRLGFEHLIATEPEQNEAGNYTGGVVGTPSYADGKVTRLRQWLKERDAAWPPLWFYSDSHNDLPLLHLADHPVAVNPDTILRQEAEEKDWPILHWSCADSPSL